jgi:hypothetical protein
MGFEQMTPVQASTVPLFMKHKDVVVEVRGLCLSMPPGGRSLAERRTQLEGGYGIWKDPSFCTTRNRKAPPSRAVTTEERGWGVDCIPYEVRLAYTWRRCRAC